MPRGVDTSRHPNRQVPRRQGSPVNYGRDDWDEFARKAVRSGGRIVQSASGDTHIISPLGNHWGTFKQQQGVSEGASLTRLSDNDDLSDVTDRYL